MHCIERTTFGPVTLYEFGFAPIGKPLKTSFVYVLGEVVIDTAMRHMAKHVLSLLDRHRFSAVLLTHHHEDHSGNASALKYHFKIPVLAHTEANRKLVNSFSILPYQHLLFGKISPLEPDPLPQFIDLAKHTIIPIHTPGHSKDHTVFLDEGNGFLFSGDLFLGEKIMFFRSDERIGEQLDSLEKVALLEFDTLFCGHNPQLKGGKERIISKLGFLKDFHGQVGEMLTKGYSNEEITRLCEDEMIWRYDCSPWETPALPIWSNHRSASTSKRGFLHERPFSSTG